MNSRPLLSIAIPAYNRPRELEFGLYRFISQIVGRHERDVEIVISDDCSPGDSLAPVREIAERYKFIRYRRYPMNIGLERNLFACADDCNGEYLWICGDDDYIEPDDGVDFIMKLLREGNYDCYVLNRTRRSFDLSRQISANWMRLNTAKSYEFPGLREFCCTHGFISVIGFISVNIFRRQLFQDANASRYLGTMYPQLGAMVQAFHDRRTLLVGRPLVCHRTQTSEEKRAALGAKATEADFMADVQRRNAMYFSHPFVAMLDELVAKGAFTAADIVRIPENTVIQGLLVDFLIQTVSSSHGLGLESRPDVWARTARFFRSLPLDAERQRNIERVLTVRAGASGTAPVRASAAAPLQQTLTISVVTPSYNQGQFLGACLDSVRDQAYKPIEHFVFDPGSTDDSRAIAAAYPHVTLVAEPDEGQSDAVNKGFQRARGDIIAWLNSDDCYAHPQVFERVVQRFLEDDVPDIVYGKGIYINEFGEKLRDYYVNWNPATLPWRFQQEDGIMQPSVFIKRSVIEKIGPLRADLHFSMDYEYWIRCVNAGIKFAYVDEDFAQARYHAANKTWGMRDRSYAEVCSMMKEHFGYVSHFWLRRYAEYLAEGYDGVLVTAGNAGVKDTARLALHYRELMRAYNCGHDTYALLQKRAVHRGYGDTLREMKALGIAPVVPCQAIPVDQTARPGFDCYTVGPRRWAFKASWKAAEIAKAHEFLHAQVAARRNDTCIIVGNGPSLNKTNLALLKGQDVIVSNNAFLGEELMRYATYLTVVNYLVAEQSAHHINRLMGVHKIVPWWLAYCLNPGPNTHFVNAVGLPEFSRDMFRNMSWRHTVTFFNLHLAYGLGYRRVVLIGVDHNYVQPGSVKEQAIIQSAEADENHFHPDYFRGKKWQAADVDMMEEMYRLAKAAYEEDGREIINATAGGRLELFRRMTLEEALAPARPSRRDAPAAVPAATIPDLSRPLIGPFARDRAAHWDETAAIAEIFSGALSGATMIDVGAHHGTALAHFLDKGWKVFAFEPDAANRRRLEERLAKHPNARQVTLDARAASNETRQGVAFYASEVSTGISGLSAFHASHHKTQEVDTVTLREALAGQDLAAVDFLKIDTEGHDLFVLQGFPWERFRPAVIECEFEDAKTVPLGYAFHDLAKYLVEKGYTVYVSEWHPVIRYGIRHDWNRLTRYPCELSDGKAWGNLLAFRDPVDEAKVVEAARSVMAAGAGAAAAPRRGGTVVRLRPRRNIRPPRIRRRSRTLVLLGNGPSLKGFDFGRFRAFDAIGMNAAYRYWDRIGWYPRYYICLDKVVGLSHKDEIARLMRERVVNGIECFLLRRNLIEVLPRELASLDCVLDYEALIAGSSLFMPMPVSTGAQSALLGALLGYDRMILMGVDNNYVEKVSGAAGKGGSVLEIAATPAGNPNYFFDGYQVAGDRYNLPNPVPDLHLNSWRAVAPILVARGVKVWNGSSISRVDAFPKRDFGEIEREESGFRQARGPGKDMEDSNMEGRQAPEGDARWDVYRWAVTVSTAKLAVPIRRDRATLAVIACYVPLAEERLAGLRAEVDGARVPHAVHDGLNPRCIVLELPARANADLGMTELTLALSATSPSGGDPDPWLAGLLVSAHLLLVPAVPVLPARFYESRGGRFKRWLGLSARGGGVEDFPLSHFDGLAYLESYGDVTKSVLAGRTPSALEHYRRHGRAEGRRFTLATARAPNEGGLADVFDGVAYLETHSDVADSVRAGIVASAFDHYLRHGRAEGRKAAPCFDGTASRGTALDLVRFDAVNDARSEINAVRAELDAGARQLMDAVADLRGKLAADKDEVARLQDELERVKGRSGAQNPG